MAAEPHECKRWAEDHRVNESDRLIWALLAVAGELREIRRLLAKGRR